MSDTIRLVFSATYCPLDAALATVADDSCCQSAVWKQRWPQSLVTLAASPQFACIRFKSIMVSYKCPWLSPEELFKGIDSGMST